MKKESTSRRKKLPLLLGALLIISVAAYGTRAYFSDSATQQADIKLELGNLDIESVDSNWKYTPEGDYINTVLFGGKNEVKNEMIITNKKAKNITNVQPGDKFEKIFKFKNSGTLAQNVTVDNTVDDNTNADDSIFEVTFERIESNGTTSENQELATIRKGEILNYKMVISVKTGEGFDETYNQKNSVTILGDPVFNALANNTSAETLLENAVTVTAKQTNDVIE